MYLDGSVREWVSTRVWWLTITMLRATFRIQITLLPTIGLYIYIYIKAKIQITPFKFQNLIFSHMMFKKKRIIEVICYDH